MKTREPAHKREIISQLRMHDPSETSGVCSRAIQEIESLRYQLAEVTKERDALREAIRSWLPSVKCSRCQGDIDEEAFWHALGLCVGCVDKENEFYRNNA